MYWYSRDIESLAIVELMCPFCGQVSNTKISRPEEFHCIFIIFNLWSAGSPFATCGNCHNSYELDKNWTYDFLDSVGIMVQRSYATRNIISLGIPLTLIGIVIYVL